MSRTTVLTNGTIITPYRSTTSDLVIRDGIIQELRPRGIVLEHETHVDCTGLFIGPGLIDIHVHGGNGHDFISPDPEEIVAGAEFHLQHGTTSLAPSCLSIPFPDVDRAISATRKAAGKCAANILGYHVEGGYLDMEYRGGHLAEYVHHPDAREYLPLLEKHGDFITEWTLAPELPGATDLIRACEKHGVVPSAGHTRASYEEFLQAVECGLAHTTHYCCCMGNMRFESLQPGLTTGKGFAPGVLEAVLLHDEVTTEVICDGFHVHPAFIQLLLKCKGPSGVCMVSDTVFGVGMPEGRIVVGNQDVIMKNGIAIIKDRPEIIASSVTPLLGMLRFTHTRAGVALPVAWEMASSTPARILGIDDRKGVLSPGKDADLLILDRDLNARNVYVRGREWSPST